MLLWVPWISQQEYKALRPGGWSACWKFKGCSIFTPSLRKGDRNSKSVHKVWKNEGKQRVPRAEHFEMHKSRLWKVNMIQWLCTEEIFDPRPGKASSCAQVSDCRGRSRCPCSAFLGNTSAIIHVGVWATPLSPCHVSPAHPSLQPQVPVPVRLCVFELGICNRSPVEGKAGSTLS